MRENSDLEKNYFSATIWTVGRKVIEVSTLMNEWLHDSLLQDISFKALMVMPNAETYSRLLTVIYFCRKAPCETGF